jgi:RES domain-containing protein
LKVFSIAHEAHASTAEEMLSGKGAADYGGRWNSVGVPAVYCSESLSLCALEILVHLPRGVLRLYRFLEIDIPESSVVRLYMPASWEALTTQALGNRYLGPNGVLAFSVPSCVNSYENNIILNPSHQDFSAIKCGKPTDYPLDPRLLAR